MTNTVQAADSVAAPPARFNFAQHLLELNAGGWCGDAVGGLNGAGHDLSPGARGVFGVLARV